MRLGFLVVIAVGFLPAFAEPQIFDEGLRVETFSTDIANSPTSMTFIGDDALVLQRFDGQVSLIRNGSLQKIPVLDVPIARDGERGMLGITSSGSKVYIYFTAAEADGQKAIENRIYRYDWDGDRLGNPVLLKVLPSDQPYHNGGAMTNFGGNVYAVIGDNGNYGRLQNKPYDWKNDTSVILRVDPAGPYYAIGIRNSFGITVDPFTGNLWDTENGDDKYDEINFVPEYFNSGWIEIMGPAKDREQIDNLPEYGNYTYSDPEFSWEQPVAPTGISFVKSDRLKEYEDSVFVGDCNTGSLYRFKLDPMRTGFVFESPELQDRVLDVGDSVDEILFGKGFGCITDVQMGTDGLLYIVSLSEGAIFRLAPNDAFVDVDSESVPQSDIPNDGTGGCLIATAAFGTEMSLTIQSLRELRDKTVLTTESGAAFMSMFNAIYYSFSPTVADLERQNPAIKEMTKITIWPMLATLSVLHHADIDTEYEMIAYGAAVILLNVGIYFVVPAVVIMQIRRCLGKVPHR